MHGIPLNLPMWRSCPCDGRQVWRPGEVLKNLRISAGLPGYDPSPELVIEHMLANGEAPSSGTCVECGRETTEVVHVNTECERVWKKGGSSGVPTGMLVFSWLVSPLHFLANLARKDLAEDLGVAEGETFGSDKVYRLPLAICPACREALRNAEAIKQRLRKIPDYARLLDKFPRAKVRLEKVSATP